MSLELNIGRREFVSKAAVVAGGLGGVLGSATTVSAAAQEMDIEGYRDGTEYIITVNDPDGYAESPESCGYVNNGSNRTDFKGCVDNGNVDTYHFDGQVTEIWISGYAAVFVGGAQGLNREGRITVDGDACTYWIQATQGMSGDGDLESGDTVGTTDCNGELDSSFDTDYYFADGAIEGAQVNNSGSGYTSIVHDLQLQ